MPVGLGTAIASIAGPTIINGITGAVNGRKDEKKPGQKEETWKILYVT